ncbi:MAG: hypothetical protein MZV64_35715 [Ignavibacteriales bacterium]|nr:hypothetical protein [Ignavibacteriales bacterium]
MKELSDAQLNGDYSGHFSAGFELSGILKGSAGMISCCSVRKWNDRILTVLS